MHKYLLGIWGKNNRPNSPVPYFPKSLSERYWGGYGVPMTKNVYLVEHIPLKLNKTKLNKTKIIVDRHQLQKANYLHYLQDVFSFVGGLETKSYQTPRELTSQVGENAHYLFLDNRYPN